MIDVFLSYRWDTGRECCSILRQSLEEDGYTVFFDADSTRQGNFVEQIDNAIKECSFLFVVLAPGDLDRCFKSPESDWIIHEVSLAHEYGKIIIPISFKSSFSFPQECKKISTLEFLSEQELCDISGSEFSRLIKSRIYEFMKASPAKRLKEEYEKGIKQKNYLNWEIKSLQTIYNDLDFVYEFDRFFPSIVFEGADQIKYPFDSLNKKDNLFTPREPINYQNSPYFEEFKRIVGPNIHFPDLYGFTNIGLVLNEDEKVIGFKALPRKYKETVYSCHILHYEMWKAFQKTEGKRLATLDDLPMRYSIHKDLSNKEVILTGCNRSALCDICLAVIVYDKEENDYELAVAKRSKSVACYPGYLSIVPSGGFELYELENKHSPSVIKKNFSIIAAVYREYIEEIFGDTDFDKPTGNDDLRRLYRNNHVKELRESIEKTFFFEFLGVSFDMLSLRPTFSFVLKIDDEQFLYNNQILKNDENVDIDFFPLNVFSNKIKEAFDDDTPLMCESAGVYNLLKKNHLYKDAINNKKSLPNNSK